MLDHCPVVMYVLRAEKYKCILGSVHCILCISIFSGKPKVKVENQSNGKPSSNLSCEALSVFDGVTVKVQYIGDEDPANRTVSNGAIKSSQQLLLGLEERKKAAAEVTTVPLRQALSANYKNTAVTTTKNHSFLGK